ncbi:hypothetical protein OPT61_g4655 [Boeremia exigua]|uniref:Uncharacterized protein n=1 Tax=Boeremia exigua TaxID=749465 RepID=A0ACC2ID64_9PLEO|nr:hypothetical protein OPT61_g4655 [Boeremia exigua]
MIQTNNQAKHSPVVSTIGHLRHSSKILRADLCLRKGGNGVQMAADCDGLHTWKSIRGHAQPVNKSSQEEFGLQIAKREAFKYYQLTGRKLLLISNDQTGDTSTGQCREDTGNKSRHGELRNVTTATRADLAEHTDLGTERTDVTKTTKRVCGDETRTRREGGVLGVRIDEGGEGNKLVSDDLDTNETTDEQQVLALARYTEQERNRVKKVSENKLKGEIVLSIKVDVAAPPGKKTVDQVQERNDTQECANDHTSDLKTKPSTVGESVQSVGSLVLVVIGNDDASSGKRLLGFGVTELGQSKRGGDTHNTRGDESLRVQSHANVSDQDRTSNGSETRAHDLVELGHRQMGNERLDQHSRFTLTDERRSRSDDGLSTRNLHGPEEEDGKLADEPLNQTPVVHQLDDRNEEDDRRDDTEEEEGLISNVRSSEESDTLPGKSKKQASKQGNEAEDVVSDASPQNEKGDDKLDEHADDDSVPVDRLPVAGGEPEHEDEHTQTEERDDTVDTGVVLAFLAGHGSNNDDGDGKRSTGRHTQLLGNEHSNSDSSVLPQPVHRLGDDGDGNMARDEANHNRQPEQERNDPVLVLAMDDNRRNPPSKNVS